MAGLSTAVVILNWNGKALLEQFLPSVIAFSAEATVYVADNASTDGSVAFVRQKYPQVKIIQNQINGGYAKGYNEALKNLQEDILILLNSDVAVTENWLPPIVSIFENEKSTAVIQPKILDYKNQDYFEYAGAAGGFIDKYGYPFCRGRIFDVLEKDHGQYDDAAEIFWASGACFAIRNKIYKETGGFDEAFFAHQEEIDLCWRIQNLGHTIKYTGASKIYHLGGGTLNSLNPKKTFYNFRNSLFAIVKNAPSPQIWLIICVRLILDGIAGIKFLLNGKPAHLIAIVKAHFSFYSGAKKMWDKRSETAKTKNYYEVKSIVFARFLKGKKLFRHLN